MIGDHDVLFFFPRDDCFSLKCLLFLFAVSLVIEVELEVSSTETFGGNFHCVLFTLKFSPLQLPNNIAIIHKNGKW